MMINGSFGFHDDDAGVFDHTVELALDNGITTHFIFSHPTLEPSLLQICMRTGGSFRGIGIGTTPAR